jgi:TPP-dependent trihydroxycyclohexane-1,2-dione (THcHDO) dehydratase
MALDNLWFSITAVEEITGNSEWNYSPEEADVDNEIFDITYINYPEGYTGVRPTLEQIEARRIELIDTHNSKQYTRDRVKVYPSLEEQADMAYWDRKNGTTTLDDAIDAVKLQYPKG